MKIPTSEKKIPNFPSGPVLAGPQNKHFTSFYMHYANFSHAIASVMIAVGLLFAHWNFFASFFVLFKDSSFILILWYGILYH